MKNDDTRIVATIDCETNPFYRGLPCIPFAWGFFTPGCYRLFWGDDCTQQLLQFLCDYTEPLIIYAHNGGHFDFTFISHVFDGKMKVIGSRVVQAYIGIHELRDSYANIPVPLAAFGDKQNIDYQIMQPFIREKKQNRQLIEHYLQQDCVGLYDAIMRYRQQFGNALTMASAAMKQLNIVTTETNREVCYEQLNPKQDAQFRLFYHGGRVECFQSGIVRGTFNVYDVTSMYPSVMQGNSHPVSSTYMHRTGKQATLDRTTDFVTIHATSRGALPVRLESGHLTFPHATQQFFATGIECLTAQELGLLDIHEIIESFTFDKRIDFSDFISTFFEQRQEARAQGDDMLVLFYKLVMNSAYGKFALDPEHYEEYLAIAGNGEPDTTELAHNPEIVAIKLHPDDTNAGFAVPCECPDCTRKHNAWQLKHIVQTINIWARPIQNKKNSYLNVATAASITGHARAALLRGLHGADNLAYCDTDSIICTALDGVEIGGKLGQWKHEATGHTLAIAGKKQYALYGTPSQNREENDKRVKNWGDANVVKLASKGVRLTGEQIMRLAQGEEIVYLQDAPMMRLDQTQTPLTRRIRNTARIELDRNNV